jgi:hypothetical protein
LISPQYKAELKGPNFFLRAYTTQERSGDSYAAGTFGELLNEAYSPSQTKWFPEYTAAYLLARLGILPGGLQNNEQAHSTARSIADRYRLIPGTPEFNAAKDQITNTPLPRAQDLQIRLIYTMWRACIILINSLILQKS